ncbi:hypothetical protein NMK54_00185 [Nocardia otitidiscaviarum]|uniref:hypothetical protein n=1 Tax=Nocardia otitidiscaviarum TaxID=1823 RepID=UPI00163D89A8|nr:hypothetical protein [Nocardia otitidiscaviarum]MCP9618579.1 hypothetical protein [Nocardia otitidiscaviarum]
MNYITPAGRLVTVIAQYSDRNGVRIRAIGSADTRNSGMIEPRFPSDGMPPIDRL